MSSPSSRPLRVLVSVVAAGATFGLITFGLRLSLNRRPSSAPRLEPIVEPGFEKAEPIVREHVAEIYRRLQDVLSSPASSPSQRGRAFGEMGKVFLAYKYFEPAVACFRNASALDRDEFRWHYYLSDSLDGIGQIAEAAAPMATAFKLMANDATATPIDQHAALCRLGEMALRLNKPAEARGTFELALKINPLSPFALVNLAQLASRDGDHRKAIDYLVKAMSSQLNQPAIRRLLAAEYRRDGDAAKAKEYAESNGSNRKADSVDFPDPVITVVRELNRSGARQNQLGARLLELGRYQEAMTHFVRGIQAASNSFGLHFNYSACLLALDRVEEGQKELETACRMAPQADGPRAALYPALARLPSTQKRALDEALAWRKEQPGKPLPLVALAEVQVRLGLFEDALRSYKDLETLTPSEPGPRLGSARALAALRRGKEARQTLEAAADLFPGNAEIGASLARLLVTYPDDAVRDPAKALSLIRGIIVGEYTVTRAETLALALAENGQRDEALQTQRQAIANCGDDGEAAVRRRLQGILDSLEKGKPWREPWPYREYDPNETKAARN